MHEDSAGADIGTDGRLSSLSDAQSSREGHILVNLITAVDQTTCSEVRAFTSGGTVPPWDPA
jgi:hypothetical protein